MSQSAKALNSGTSLTGSTISTAVQWQGGRTALVINATQYGGGVFLQLTGPSGAGININATTYSADQSVAYDLPAGTYKLVSNIGSSVAVYASLVSIPYDF